MTDPISRRGVIAAASLAAGAFGAASAGAQAPPPAPPPAGLASAPEGQIFHTAETTSGRVLGIDNAGIKEFKGIPYGAPTGGAGRWAPPRRPAPWSGVRETIGYGQISPQTVADIRGEYAQMIMWDRHVGPGGMGEDCLNLNVWTPGLDNARRAVMVSFHGGGWTTGSGNGPMYDGANLAHFGDVVVVTVNHRLASFGYLNLGNVPGAPAELADAGAIGVADMVASLRWVRDNIAGFGGDPSRVMIFGQSGGGSKVSTLLATPSAKGLFHRAAVQSGSTLRQRTADEGAMSTQLLMGTLGAKTYGELASAHWTQLLQAQTDAAAKGANFAPVVGNAVLPHHPFDPAAPSESANVPVIISTTLEDAALRLTNFDLSEAGLHEVIAKLRPADADRVTRMYLDANPGKTPYLIQAQALTDAGGRKNQVIQGERRAALGGAPTWLYIWSWATPAYDGKFGAVHGHDVDASFHIVRSNMVGSGRAAGHVMADRLASAWVAFAKTGDPNNPAIPHWAPYEPVQRATLIFDNDTRAEDDPRHQFRELWAYASGVRRTRGHETRRRLNGRFTLIGFPVRTGRSRGAGVERYRGWLRATIAAACVAGAAPAGAAVVKTSFGVSVTVVATCRIVPGQAQGCASPARPGAATVPTPQPVVTYAHDPKTGATIETVEF
jgi:para-nitrobenzyl esterase